MTEKFNNECRYSGSPESMGFTLVYLGKGMHLFCGGTDFFVIVP
jgi:hypothetical protein